MKKFMVFLLSLVFAFAFAACGNTGKNPSDVENPQGGTPPIENPPAETKGYVYSGTPTVAPYTVCNADDTELAEKYDSMYLAIRYAGEHASSSNAMYVKDANGLKIFQRQGTSKYWVYDGTNFVGSMDSADAVAWGAEHARSYVLNGKGTGYAYLGADNYSERHPQDVYELFSGGYTYLYSPTGESAPGNAWAKYGYSYASGIVRLSEATYKDATELTPYSQWNAYVFFNISGKTNCDLGIGCFAGGEGKWAIVHNCSSDEHKTGVDPKPSFYVWKEQVVTTMKKDPKTGIYSGADDVFIEAIGGTDTWILRVTNLRTNEVFGYTHTHKDMNAGAEGFYRVLTAVSLCPVIGSVWDAQAGGYIKNVVWEDIKIARYRQDGNYDDAEKEEMYPGLSTMQYGFTQGADCAHLTIGTHKSDGTYKSGAAYKAGGKYLAFSSYYDGTHIED